MARDELTIAPATALSKPAVTLQLDRAGYALRTCYIKGFARKPGLAGDVVARFVILTDGTVARSRAGGLGYDVAGCVARTIATLHFAKPAAAVRVRVKLMFDPNPYAFYTGRLVMPSRTKSRTTRWHIQRRRPRRPSPPLHLQRLVVTNPTKTARVRHALVARWRSLQRCYQSRPGRTVSRVRFGVSWRGRVQRLYIDGNARVAACLRKRLRTVVFSPPPTGGHYDVFLTLVRP